MNPHARPEHHVVTVRTGTEDDWTYLESVECACTAPEDAPCRTYPDCGCEEFTDDADNPGHDNYGHPYVSGRHCWVVQWFAAEDLGLATAYEGVDATDATDVGVPLVARHGHIDVGWDYDHPTWWWYGEPKPLDIPLDQAAFDFGGGA